MIVTLFPRCSEDLTDLLAQKYPKLRVSIDIQLIYLKGCLYLAEHVLQLHQAILKTVLSNLTAMDLEVKSTSMEYLDTNNFSEWKERQLHLLAEEVRKGSISSETIQRILSQKLWFETLFRKVKTDEDVDCMAFRLDILMAYLIKWSTQQVQNALETPIPTHLLSVLSINSGDDEDDYDDDDKNDNLPTGLSDSVDTTKQTKRRGLTMADVIVADLLGIFRSVVLTTEKCRYVQYYFFYITSLKSEWAEKLLQIFFSILFDPDALLSLRRLCSDYIASYVSRATFLPIKFIRSSLRYLIQFLNEFLSFWNQRDSIPTIQQKESLQFLQRLNKGKAYVNPQSRLTLFYSVFQTTCYILSFTGDALLIDPSKSSESKDSCNAKLEDDTQLSNFLFEEVNDSLTCVMNSDLCPLIQCNPTIVRVSIETFRRLKLFSDLETEFDRVLSLIPLSPSNSLDEPSTIPSFPFNPYPLWYSTYYFVPLYRTWSQINSSQNSQHLQKKHSIRCDVQQHDRNSDSLQASITPLCDKTHTKPVNEEVTNCAKSLLANKVESVQQIDKVCFDHQQVAEVTQTFQDSGETVIFNDNVKDACNAPKPKDSLHDNESNVHELASGNFLPVTTTDLVTHKIKKTNVVVDTDIFNDTEESVKNNSFKNGKQLTLNDNEQDASTNELNSVLKADKDVPIPMDSSACNLEIDENRKDEANSINEQVITKALTKETESVEVEGVDATEKFVQTSDAIKNVSVSQINNQLVKIVDALNSQIKTPNLSPSVTVPTTTFNALLTAILSVTTASSSTLTSIPNFRTSQLSVFQSTQGSCDHTSSPQSTTCVDSADGESVFDPLLRSSGLNVTPLPSYNEPYYHFDKKHVQNVVDSIPTNCENNCFIIPSKKPSKYQLSRTSIQELACKKHLTRCRTSHLSLLSKTNSIKKEQHGEKHGAPVALYRKISSSQLTTPILDLSEDYMTVKEKNASFGKLTSGEFSLEKKATRAQETKKNTDFSFSFNSAPFREEQILEELEPFLEWDASGFTTASTDLLKKNTRSKQKAKCGSRMLELLSSRAYRSSLKKPFDYLGDQNSVHMKSLRKKKRQKKESKKEKSSKLFSNKILNLSPCDEEMAFQPFVGENIEPQPCTSMKSAWEQNPWCNPSATWLEEPTFKITHDPGDVPCPVYDESGRHKKRKRNKNRDNSAYEVKSYEKSSKRSKKNSYLL
ncbi:uncharacterized protein LOC128883219 isoform X2 [Hylaeus volcanicus]|nr:uncharacterized protein LOC128883219 isoform X2 [Hylaeus volcanicus]XP_053991312.1 uncharacterized protein LOC128883219 isoform X2 [Hylaeus volcanicus]